MRVLVDTCIWSAAFRRNNSDNAIVKSEVAKLSEIVMEMRAHIIGPIRQEVLSGIRASEQFNLLRKRLAAFPDLEITTADFETAAEFFNVCRSKGIQGSNTDFLICAVSERHEMAIFTSDQDFGLFAKYLPIILYSI